MSSAETAEATIDFWTALEALSPAQVQLERGRFPITPILEALPWPPIRGMSVEPDEGQSPRRPSHRIYLDVFNIGEVERILSAAFPTEGYDEPPRRNLAATASFVVDSTGEPEEASFMLSSFPWAVGELLEGRSCHGFASVERTAKLAFETWRERLADTPLDRDGISELAVLLSPWTRVVEAAVVHDVASCRIDPRSEASPLNSFYLEDLLRVRTRRSPLLWHLLEAPVVARQDVLGSADVLKAQLHPDRMGYGSWPSAHNLSIHQQAAVVEMIRWDSWPHLPVVGVNGPPGTGKTTLVKELVATVVCERATRLAQFDDPRDAFVPHSAVSDEKGQRRTISVLAEAFKGSRWCLRAHRIRLRRTSRESSR